MTTRYYLETQLGAAPAEKREVTREAFCQAERNCGFHPKLARSHPDYMITPATNGFTCSSPLATVRGAIEQTQQDEPL